MAIFICNRCDQYIDIDYNGYNVDESTDEEYCDDCWYEVCDEYQVKCETLND